MAQPLNSNGFALLPIKDFAPLSTSRELARGVEKIEIMLADGSVVTCDSLKEAFQKLKKMKESMRLRRHPDVVKPRGASAAVDRDGKRMR
jgi:hypothetical protein